MATPAGTSSVLHIISRLWFYAALVAVFLIGWCRPDVGQAIKHLGIGDYLVAAAFFLNGFMLPPASLLGNLRQWPVLVTAMVVTFLAPAGIVLAARALFPGVSEPLMVGFQLIAVMPTTLVSAVVLTRVARGNASMALYITILANLVAIFVVPSLLLVTLGAGGAHIDVTGTVSKLFYTVFIPTVIGQGLRALTGDWADRRRPLLGIVSQVILLYFIITGITELKHDDITPSVWHLVFWGGLTLHLMLLAIADSCGRLLRTDEATRRAMTICTSEKTLVLTAYLWKQVLLPINPAYAIAFLPGIVYYVIQIILDSFLAQWWGQRQIREPEPLPPAVEPDVVEVVD